MQRARKPVYLEARRPEGQKTRSPGGQKVRRPEGPESRRPESGGQEARRPEGQKARRPECKEPETTIRQPATSPEDQDHQRTMRPQSQEVSGGLDKKTTGRLEGMRPEGNP